MSQLIPQDLIESIRQETNIVDIVGQYVQLKKSGKNYLGLCPFHDEKTPSFSVAEDKQIYHCFGCGKGGNVFSFIQEVEGLSFPESVEKVAEYGNVDVSGLSSFEDKKAVSPRALEETTLIEIHEKTMDLYHHILMNTQIGEKALTYLENRGLDRETIETFKIGFAPKDRSVLYQVLKKENYSDALLGKTGLMFQLENGDWLDRFYQRIMFPITNNQGKVIGFSGRILDDDEFDSSDQPKYLNSPETELFNKRFVLFNFNKARAEIRKKNEVILFEGFMDVISAWVSGVKNGVASMGTSLTVEQIKMLERVSEDVLICYDGDSAGVEASSRAIDIISKESMMNIQVISIPHRMDPDDYRMKYGNNALYELVKNSRETVFQFKKDYYKRQRNLALETDKLDYLDDVLGELVKVHSVIEIDMALTQLADEFGVSKESLQNELRGKKQATRKNLSFNHETPSKEMVLPKRQDVRKMDQVEKAEMLLIYRLLSERNVHQFLSEQPNFSFVHDEYQELYLHLSTYLSINGEIAIADFIDYLKEDKLKQVIVTITVQSFSEESTPQELLDCVSVISQAETKQQIKEWQIKQKEAKTTGNKQLEEEATFTIIQLQIQLKKI